MTFIRPILSLLCIFFISSLQANVTSYFNQIKTDPKALYAFFKMMPKGGELHYHLAGGPYPETMLLLASKGDYCLDKKTLAMNKTARNCNGVKSKDILNQPELYSQIIKDWSMKDFIPGKESGHDHFFNGFMKYMPIVFDYRSALLANVIQRAAAQQEQYLEIMDIPDNAQSTLFGTLIKNIPSYAEKKKLLLANKDFQNNISQTVEESERTLTQAREHLGCKTNPQAEPCKVEIKFLYYSLREQSKDNLFAQTLNAFEAVSRSKGNLVGVNLVEPEDGIISLRDYHQQMLIFQFFHQQYPNVNISLHAGELEPGPVKPKDLGYHIRDALFTGHAQRIGHGAAIAHEDKAGDTLNYMAKHQLAVEINLISNLKILNLSGPDHPLNSYLSHRVPVVLSTDDEGVLRTNLTRQYVAAVLKQGLDYEGLKQINRNTLTYAFVPGKSIWADASKAKLIQECADLNSDSCKEFITHNEKATLQWNLEQKLISFENKYNNSIS
ncbi:adenosine deaminase family protein [Legionella maioricensis]|uniref:adenosine deaminase n=1 Tax=Legionella maioricensis TaxID=2896528 RepID=A0A9X2D016_9GAMM|nr:adenosine deaminase [Legionella maioricensis]MCL9683352.1 adenosine deaminase [Legionella maioricensis]MCL9685952.1 adenosine deaminase [Legionella maioricensis]